MPRTGQRTDQVPFRALRGTPARGDYSPRYVRASAADSTKLTVPTKDDLGPGFFENPRDERARRLFFGQHQRLQACVWHPWRLSLLHSSFREPSDHAEEGRMPILNIRDGEIRTCSASAEAATALFRRTAMSAFGSAPRRRESPVEEESTQRIVD